MKIQGFLLVGVSLLTSAMAVWVLNAEFVARGVSYDLGKGLSGALVLGVVATLAGGIGFGMLRVATEGKEKASIVALAFFAFLFLIFFNAVFMAFGLDTGGTVWSQAMFFWEPLATSLAQVVFSAWLSRYLN